MKNFITIILMALALTSCSGGGGGPTIPGADSPSAGDIPTTPTSIPTLSATSTAISAYVGETSTITLTKTHVDLCETTNLPAYASLNSATCVITLNPVSYSAVAANFSIIGKNTFASPVLSTDSVIFTLTLLVRPPVLSASANTASLAVNTAMTNITVESTSALTECSATIVVPGLSLNLVAGKCVISGTPTATGAYTYGVLAKKNGSAFGAAFEVSINVYVAPVITATQAEIDGKIGDAISVNFNANAGVTVSTCNVTPALPSGLTLTRYTDRCALSGSLNATSNSTGATYDISATSSAGVTSNTISYKITSYDVFCKGVEDSFSQATTNNGVSAATPIIICTAQGLIDYAANSANNGKYYRLQKNISINNVTNSVVPTFNGHLNGAGYSVTYNTTGTSTCQGFIGTMTAGSIRNVHIKNVTTIDTNERMGFVGCVNASGATVTFNDILTTNTTANNPSNSELTGLFIGRVGTNTTVTINGMYTSIDHLDNADPMNFSLAYSINAGVAVNQTATYYSNLSGALGFSASGMTEVDHTTMMASPAATLSGLSSTSWNLIVNNYPALALKQNRIYSDAIVQP